MYSLSEFLDFVKDRFRYESDFSRRMDKAPEHRLAHQKRASFYLGLEAILVDLKNSGYVLPGLGHREQDKASAESSSGAPDAETPPNSDQTDQSKSDKKGIDPRDIFGMQIMQLFDNVDMLHITDVTDLHNERFHENLPQGTFENKLYKMHKSGHLERAIGRRGYYRLPRKGA
ncbi:MAG TPA: hypothetical protein VEB64_09555 [Azospirillaceae bacterium]|nr:hypothetical protein [Azospirillaceae bacterium]